MSEAYPTPTTAVDTLRAVNMLLHAVRLAEVQSLAAVATTTAAQEAYRLLGEVSAEVQSRGWHFNSEEEFPLEPNDAGEIAIPANAVSVVPHIHSYTLNLTERGMKLYSNKLRSFTIGQTVYVNMILLFDFEEVPAPIRWHILCEAGQRWGVGRAPDPTNYRFSTQEATRAKGRAEEYDQESRDRPLPERNPHFGRMTRR